MTGAAEIEQLAKVHPAFYARLASRGTWQTAPHLELICGLLVKLWRGEIKRLAISVPPRHGKSLLLSQYFPAWWLGTRPGDQVIVSSYQERLVRRWSRKVRDDLAAWGPRLWGHGPHPRASTAAWDVWKKGQRTGGSLDAVGQGGALTGKGAHLLVCDDLFKGKQEADSESIRENVWDWFTSEALTRLEAHRSACVVVFTRWHYDDVIGRLEAQQARGELKEPWTFVNLPAIATDEDDPIGRKPGEALWPERFPLERLEAIRQEVGPHVWQSLYQGRPAPADGALFKKEWLKFYEPAGPRLARIAGRAKLVEIDLTFMTADLAASTKTSADWTVLAVWGLSWSTRSLFLLDLVRARMEGPDILPRMRHLAGVHKCAAIHMEKGGFQLSLIQQAARMGLPVRELLADRDKVARALPATGALESGRVYFPVGAQWQAEFETELLQFPSGRHDDQVDVLAYAVLVSNQLLDEGPGLQVDAEESDDGGWWTGSRGGRW